MSRSRFYGHGHPRRWDPLDDWRPRIACALVREDVDDGLREVADVPDGDHTTIRASNMSVTDTRWRHHRGRRRSAKARSLEKSKNRTRNWIATLIRLNPGMSPSTESAWRQLNLDPSA